MKRVRYFGTMREPHDNDLRKLFKAAGHAAPEQDLTARIMARVAVTPMHQATRVVPVIGIRGWIAIGAAFVLIIVLVCTTKGTGSAGPISLWMDGWSERMGRISLPSGERGIWLTVASACALFLAWLDRTLAAAKGAR